MDFLNFFLKHAVNITLKLNNHTRKAIELTFWYKKLTPKLVLLHSWKNIPVFESKTLFRKNSPFFSNIYSQNLQSNEQKFLKNKMTSRYFKFWWFLGSIIMLHKKVINKSWKKMSEKFRISLEIIIWQIIS